MATTWERKIQFRAELHWNNLSRRQWHVSTICDRQRSSEQVYRSRHGKPPRAARCCHVANDLTTFSSDRQTNKQTNKQKTSWDNIFIMQKENKTKKAIAIKLIQKTLYVLSLLRRMIVQWHIKNSKNYFFSGPLLGHEYNIWLLLHPRANGGLKNEWFLLFLLFWPSTLQGSNAPNGLAGALYPPIHYASGCRAVHGDNHLDIFAWKLSPRW